MSFLQQLQNYWSNLSSGERVTLSISSGVVLAGLVFLFMWASAERYDTVFSAGDSSKVRSAAQALEEAGIEYKISDDGMRLLTTSENVGRARIVTAGTTSTAGMEMLDSIQLGISPQHERWIYLNALQGELTRTIGSLDEVAAARVHIVEPERNSFLNPSAQASASVTVKLEPGQSLSSAQIRGITSLVAGAVKGLTSKDVVLIDETGRLLSGPKEQEASNGASTASEARQEHEVRLRSKLIAQLGQILGSTQHVSAAVTVDVVTETTEKSVQALDPTTQVTISEKINESASQSANAGGVPGTESNLPEQGNTAAQPNDSTEKFQAATNYEYTRTVERTVLPPGSLKRVSASILVNSFAIEALVAESTAGMTPEDLQAQIEKAAQTAVGYDTNRGDAITVSFVPFSKLEATGDLSSSTLAFTAYMPYLVPVIGLVLAFLLLRPLITNITSTVSSSGGGGGGELTPDELQALQEKLGVEGNSLALANRLRSMVANFEEVDAQELNRLIQMQEQPSAEVIRRWLRASS
ncbi:MAG: flagellar basal-body MS-ring/collar protein FliF [Myxococcota bacterium]|nr:flagellar basal-body MS-ring/collar protein FliF [Myxococcota bacterium]